MDYNEQERLSDASESIIHGWRESIREIGY